MSRNWSRSILRNLVILVVVGALAGALYEGAQALVKWRWGK